MSRKLVDLVYSKRCGSMARKAILVAMADRANDDGSDIWVSKVRIAEEVECSKQTVISVIRELEADGLLKADGKRRCGHGYTVTYNIHVPAVLSLPDARDRGPKLDPAQSNSGPVKNETGPKLDPMRSNSELEGSNFGPQEVKPLDPNRPITVVPSSSLVSAREREPSKSWSGHPWSRAIFEAAGPGLADPEKDHRVWLDLAGRLTAWEQAGWDLALDVLPVIAAKTAQPRQSGPYFTFRYLEADIATHRALRLRPAPTVEIIDEPATSRSGNTSGANARRNGGQRPSREHGGGSLFAAAVRLQRRFEDEDRVPGEWVVAGGDHGGSGGDF